MYHQAITKIIGWLTAVQTSLPVILMVIEFFKLEILDGHKFCMALSNYLFDRHTAFQSNGQSTTEPYCENKHLVLSVGCP